MSPYADIAVTALVILLAGCSSGTQSGEGGADAAGSDAGSERDGGPADSQTPVDPANSAFGIQGFVEVNLAHPLSFTPALNAGVKWIRLEGTNGMVWDLVDPGKTGEYNWTKSDALATSTSRGECRTPRRT